MFFKQNLIFSEIHSLQWSPYIGPTVVSRVSSDRLKIVSLDSDWFRNGIVIQFRSVQLKERFPEASRKAFSVLEGIGW